MQVASSMFLDQTLKAGKLIDTESQEQARFDLSAKDLPKPAAMGTLQKSEAWCGELPTKRPVLAGNETITRSTFQ